MEKFWIHGSVEFPNISTLVEASPKKENFKSLPCNWKDLPNSLQLDTLIQIPKFVGKNNGEYVDSWIHSISTYCNTFLGLTEEWKLHIVAFQLEGLAQTWWDTNQEKTTFVVKIGDAPGSSTIQPLKSWAQLCEALRSCLYPPLYLQYLFIIWHQLYQLPTQGVKSYIPSCILSLIIRPLKKTQ